MTDEHTNSDGDDISLPDFWSYLDVYAFGAADEDFRRFAGDDHGFLTALAAEIVALRAGIVIEHPASHTQAGLDMQPWDSSYDDEEKLRAQIREATDRLRSSYLDLSRRDPRDWPDALRFAVEQQLAWRFLPRTRNALDRYGGLRPLVSSRGIPSRVRPYLQELTDLFFTGFDAATVAFACACFEQLAKDALIATGKCTQPQLTRDRALTADGLRLLLREHSLLAASDGLAKRLIDNRNSLLHRHWPDNRIGGRQALDAIESLLAVSRELEPAWPSAP